MIVPSSGAQLEVEAAAPQRPSSPCLILTHPHPQMGGDMQNKIIDTLFSRSVEKGWGAVRFNFRGVGASTGTFDFGAGETDDVLAVLRFASEQFDRPCKILTLVGYSFGSWVGAKAAASLSELGRLVLIAPPLRTMDFSILKGIKHPKHVFAAGRDEYASLPSLEAWFTELTPPKSLKVLEEADHQFTGWTTKLVSDVLRAVNTQ